MFFEEFSQLIEHLMEDYIYPLVVAGDFNFHVDDLNHRDALKFTDLLESVNLIQHVKSPTHRHGHTLDLIITRKEEDMIADVQVLADVYCDHRVICCKINHPKPPPAKILKTYRPTKSLDVTKLQRDMADAISQIDSSTSTRSLYNDALKGIYDTLALIQTRWIRHHPQAPWYDDNLRQAKRDKRRLERKFRKSGLTVDKQQFELKCSEYNSLLETSKRNFFKSRIEQADRNQLFKLVDGLFSVNTTVLPPYDSLEQLTGDFNAFFIGKIQGLRMELTNPSSDHDDEKQRILYCEFPQFTPPSNESIKNVLSSLSNKTCSLDPIPTHVIKDNISSVLPMVSGIVRQSFSNGIFPTSLKTSLVRPKLKKPDLKPDLLANYRPIANIPFLSKVLENKLPCKFTTTGMTMTCFLPYSLLVGNITQQRLRYLE